MSRAPKGKVVKVAKILAKVSASPAQVAEFYDTKIGSLRCAARRLGIKVRERYEDRNIYPLRKSFFFRVRTKELNAFWHLGRDIEKARAMRDRLEKFFYTL